MSFRISFDGRSVASYEKFLAVRRCPQYRFVGREAIVPDKYAVSLGMARRDGGGMRYAPWPGLFDYQRDVAGIAIREKKYALFIRCGYGKTFIISEFARHAVAATGKKFLIVSPLMVVPQTVAEINRFYGGELSPQPLSASALPQWLATPGDGIGVTNFEAIRESYNCEHLCGIGIDEASMLKSHYGKWGVRLIEMGRGLEYKMTATGTPAPNDRIEYANHAVFLDKAKTVNEFLGTYFVNRGETSNRWELRPHALAPFYRFLASWAVFLNDPATYGWKDNCGTIPPVHVHIEDVPLTDEQRDEAMRVTGKLVAVRLGGIGDRGKVSQIAKGKNGIATNKPGYIRDMLARWPDESTLVWCHYNDEQDRLASILPDALSMDGETGEAERAEQLRRFIGCENRTLITKPKILGFGLNLQVCTRQIFSGLKDSYEEYHQAASRSNRVGSTRPLHLHIPVTELEYPFVENVLAKAHRVDEDTREQEALFKEKGWNYV